MGYYDAAKGVYVGDSGQSDYDRTIEAIKYYEKNGMTSQRQSAVNYASGKGYTQPGYTASKTTVTKPRATTTTETRKDVKKETVTPRNTSSTGQGSSQYYVPYEKELQDLIRDYPKYTPLSQSEIESQANNYANLQIDPQLTALSQSLRNAIAAANSQKGEINAAYSGVGTTADRLLGDAQKQGEISAVARGGGRSGAVEYTVGQLKQPIMEQVTQAEADKAAKLSSVAEYMTNAQTTYDEKSESLEAQRGRLVAQQLAAIKELDYAKQIGSADAILAATERLSAVTNARNQFDNTLLQSYSDMMGEVPGEVTERPVITGSNNSSVNNDSGSQVGLRGYIESKGGTVDFTSPDGSAMNGTVTINGKSYSASQLMQKGATLKNGSWYIPESVLRGMM